MREKGFEVNNVLRFSDTCAAQFRSKYVNGDLRNMKKNLSLPDWGQVTLCYFEPNEGKNISDVIGSICKNSWKRSIFQNREGIITVDHLVDRMKSGLKEETKNFKHLIIESFPPITRLPKKDLKEETIKGIMKCSQIFINQKNELKSLELGCLSCTVSQSCSNCS